MTDWDYDRANGDEAGEEIIELTDIVMMETDTETEDFDMDLELEEKEITFPADQSAGQESPLSLTLTSEQIEAALEKIIEKQFADKIQTLLFQVMEKVIEREIAGIRESLQQDLDQIGNV